MNTQNIIVMPVDDLKPFKYFLTQDVYTDMGVLIATKNSLISPKIITKLRIYKIEKVNVINTINPSNSNTSSVKNPKFVKDTKILKEFENIYLDTAEKLQTNFSDIAKGKEINTSEIKKTGEDIVNILHFNSDVFNYLSTMKATDDVTFNHCLNVSILCQIFGKYLSLSENEIELLSTTGLLHDIGKTMIDQKLINKKTSLTNEEFEIVKRHVLYSYKIVENHNIDNSVKMGILMHHERLDGSGYLTGIKNGKIPKFSRIVSIIDIYDAMTQSRPYRDKLLPLSVLDYLKNNSITKLDYALTSKFIDFAARSYKGNWVRLNSGEEGKIVYINPDNIHKPLIQIDNTIVDLRNEYNLEIEEIY